MRPLAQRKGHGRRPLRKPLERRRVVYDLEEVKRQCPQCQEELKRIGEEVSERLEYVPALRGDRCKNPQRRFYDRTQESFPFFPDTLDQGNPLGDQI